MNFTKEIKALKQLTESLQAKQDVLENMVAEREETFNDKSEKWQESQKGLDFQEKTKFLDDQCSELAGIISDLEMHLDTLDCF